MKVRRKDWEELQLRVKKLEMAVMELKEAVLIQVETGPLMVNVVVPMILSHLNAGAIHGYGWLQPIKNEQPK